VWIAVSHTQRMGTAYASATWPVTEGRVLDSGVERLNRSRGRDDWRPAIRYSYRVDGEGFVGSTWRVLPNYVSTEARAQQIVASYAPGAAIKVHYNPRNPTEATLVPGVVGQVDLFLAGAFFLGSAFLGVTLMAVLTMPSLGKSRLDATPRTYVQFRARLLRCQHAPPRAVQASDLLGPLVDPLWFGTTILALSVTGWLFVAPLLGTVAAVPLATLALSVLAGLSAWELARLWRHSFALKHGVLAEAMLTEVYRTGNREWTELYLDVQGPERMFKAVRRTSEPWHTALQGGAQLTVLIHPQRDRVLELLPPNLDAAP
jgi:hypothetical protein